MNHYGFRQNRRWRAIFDRGKWLVPLVVLISLGQMKEAIAHGVAIKYQTTQAIEIQAAYDNGEPLANAQVTVYAPDGSDPWSIGKTDTQGYFTFTPDAGKSGNWEVKVRLAGHGDLISIPIQSKDNSQPIQASAGDSSYSPLQKGMMAASVIWGCIGTALFFQRRKG